MSLSSGPNLGLLINGNAGEQHYLELMRQWRGFDALIQAHVRASQSTPPSSPADGDCYIVGSVATGSWATKETSIARYNTLASAWEFYTPSIGWCVYNEGASKFFMFTGSTWTALEPVQGPTGVTANDFAQFDGATGKLVKGGVSLDTSTSLGTSNTKVPTQGAIKSYVDAQMGTRVATASIGTSVQAFDSDLEAIAGLTPSNTHILQWRTDAGNTWTNRTPAQISTDLQGTGLDASSTGFRGIPLNIQSSNYTLIASDSGKCIHHPTSDPTARVFTIPSNASVAFPVGTVITFDNDIGAGVVSITIDSDTLVLVGTAGSTGTRTLAPGGQATAIKVSATRWRISGLGLS